LSAVNAGLYCLQTMHFPRATRRAWISALAAVVLTVALQGSAHAQAIDDGVMMAKGELFTGDVYTHDAWDEYWEGGLKRDNGNIGTLTTKSHTVLAVFGLTDRLNILSNVPYVWTEASQGVLHGMNGMQDLTIAAKYSVVDRQKTPVGALRLLAVLAGSLPMTDYTPDFLPLSIGSASKRISFRGTASMQGEDGIFVDASAAFTSRASVELDRPYYFTDDQLYMTSTVSLPGVADYEFMGGFRGPRLMAAATVMVQHMANGGDIRRQDMPFVSNRMNAMRVGGVVMYPLPKLAPLAVRVAYAHTVSGRNVGQSNTVSLGLMYRFHVYGRPTP
jgi:hypothetical protein